MINRSESQLIARDQNNQVRKTTSRPMPRKAKRATAPKRRTH